MNKPFVAIVDDRPEVGASQIAADLNDRGNVSAEAFLPGDITEQLLSDAVVVLVDYRIEDWPARAESTEIGLKPRNGLALAAVLREYCRPDEPTAIALLSSQLEDLFGDLSPSNRRHVLARVASLEWVFSKEDQHRLAQVETLALGMQRLRDLVDTNSLTAQSALLDADQGGIWNSAAEASVDRCLPPVNELAQLTHGSAFARWFLQRVLPYPAFLVDINHLAARLRVTPASLSRTLSSGNDVSNALRTFEYCGVFANFLGKRWWRSCLEDWLWELTGGRSFNATDLTEALFRLSGHSLEKIAIGPDPVVVIGPNYESTERFLPRESCIAVFPDDWPAYADKAYAAIDEVSDDPKLELLVMHDELWRLGRAD